MFQVKLNTFNLRKKRGKQNEKDNNNNINNSNCILY